MSERHEVQIQYYILLIEVGMILSAISFVLGWFMSMNSLRTTIPGCG
jgi:hypothetical protein